MNDLETLTKQNWRYKNNDRCGEILEREVIPAKREYLYIIIGSVAALIAIIAVMAVFRIKKVMAGYNK